jgi:Skp family chaperone for outer membrane proteins
MKKFFASILAVLVLSLFTPVAFAESTEDFGTTDPLAVTNTQSDATSVDAVATVSDPVSTADATVEKKAESQDVKEKKTAKDKKEKKAKKEKKQKKEKKAKKEAKEKKAKSNSGKKKGQAKAKKLAQPETEQKLPQ